MSRTLYIANTLQFDNFVSYTYTDKFVRLEIDGKSSFAFSNIIGGDKSIFFVCASSNRLVEINAKEFIRHKTHNTVKTPITLIDHDKDNRIEMTKIEYPNLMEDSIVYNIQYVMGKDYVYLVDKKGGNVGSFSLTTGQLLVNNYSDHRGIRKFIAGPLSSCHVVLTYDGTIFENGKEVVFFSTDPQPNILRAACCGRGSILASSHDLYARGGDNVFFVFSEKFGDYNQNVSSTQFVHIAKFEHEIRDIQCGYFHTVVLLQNNELFACGYNCLNQATWDNTSGEIKQFTKIQYSFGYIERFGCSSRGTWVVSGDEVTMVGEVVEHFTTLVSNTVVPKIIKFHLEGFACDTLTNCGWHYVMYKQNSKKSNYFKERLHTMVDSERISDLDFIYQ